MHTKLSQQGLKQTPARLAVLELFKKHKKPLDASEIIQELNVQLLDVNQATVYRILEIFLQKDIIRKLEFQEGKYRYELKTGEHHHLVCESCGSIEDISDCNIPQLEKEIAIKKRFLVKRHSLEFFGLCQNCQR